MQGPLKAWSVFIGTNCHRHRSGDMSNSEYRPDHGEESAEGPGPGLGSISPAKDKRSRGLIVECALVVTGWVGQQVGKGCKGVSRTSWLSSTSVDMADEAEGLRERAGPSTSRDVVDELSECSGANRSRDIVGDEHVLAGQAGFAG